MIGGKEGLRTLARLLRLARPVWGGLLLAALLGTLTVGSQVALLATGAWLISAAALQPSVGDLQIAIVGVRFFGIARGGFRYLERLAAHRATFNWLAWLRVWFYTWLEPLAPAGLSAHHSGDLLSRAVADIDKLENLTVRVLGPVLVALLVSSGMLIFAGSFDPRLAVVLAVFYVIGGIALPLGIGRLAAETGRRQVSARAELQVALVDGVQGMADLLACNAAGEQMARVAAFSERLRTEEERAARLEASQEGLQVIIAGAALLAVLAMAVGRVRGIGLAALALGVVASFEAIAPLAPAVGYLGAAVEAGRRLFEVVGGEPQPLTSLPLGLSPSPPVERGIAQESQAHSADGSPLSAKRGGAGRMQSILPVSCQGQLNVGRPKVGMGKGEAPALSVRNLTFRYAADEPDVLHGLSFRIEPGEHVAIVGPSGAGKSTLINLLVRFWEADAGRIELNGEDVRDLPADAVRAQMGVLPQRAHLFNASLRENLLIARPDASEDQIFAAARAAQIHDFIAGLPQGYDTWAGETGARLSGGERQRLALARVLLRDVPLWLLDEPTAHLDAITGAAVLDALMEASAGRTVLAITHDLAGLEHFDRVLVLREGRIAAPGVPGDLLAGDGRSV